MALDKVVRELQFDDPEADVRHARRKPWSWLLKHVFEIDVNVCPKCAGPMKWRQGALTADALREGLARAGLSASMSRVAWSAKQETDRDAE